MTALLASVRTAAEAEIALAGGADVIDLKDPGAGALGRLPASVIEEAVTRVAGRRPISATVGDPPLAPGTVGRAVCAMADLGVDLVKVGLAGEPDATLVALAAEAKAGVRIVCVLFADRRPDLGMIERLVRLGVVGVMLDTADKRAGGLRDHIGDADLAAFVDRARAAGLVCGLAGSLGRDDIASLAALGPDLLGFRGALCADGRGSPLEAARLRAVRARLGATNYGAATRIASAAAGAQSAAWARTSAAPGISSARST